MGVVMALAAMALFVGLVGCTQPQAEEKQSLEAVNDVAYEGTKFEDPFYVMLVGNDSRQGTVEINKESYADGKGRSDTCMLLYVDPKTYHVAIVTVPRDTECVYDGQKMKINDTYYWGGDEALERTVKELTGVDVRYYFDIGFVEFEKFIDQLGGITANVPIDLSLQDIVSGDQIKLSAGDQDLNGAEALVLARCRKQYVDMDVSRQIQDRAIVQGIITKAVNDPTFAKLAVTSLYANAKTDMPEADCKSLVDDFCDHASQLTIVSGTGPFEGATDGDTNLYMVARDEEGWQQVINTVEAGGDPTTVIEIPPIVAR